MDKKLNKKKLNKRAALFHWAVFGILIALGIFLSLTIKQQEKMVTQGVWSTLVLKMAQEAEEELLNLDQIAKYSVGKVLLELGEKGGFEEKSPCGEFDSLNLWNNQTDFCFPDYRKNFQKLFNRSFSFFSQGSPWEDVFYEFSWTDGVLRGKTNEKRTLSLTPLHLPTTRGEVTLIKMILPYFYLKYTYTPNFVVNLAYDLEKEYSSLKEDAQKLVLSCRNEKNLINCLNKHLDNLTMNWHLDVCDYSESLVFYRVYLAYLTCLESEGDNCFCNVPLRSLSNSNLEGEHSILFEKKKDNALLTGLVLRKGALTKTLNLSGVFHNPPSRLYYEYNNEGELDETELVFVSTSNPEEEETLTGFDEICLYRNRSRKGNIWLIFGGRKEGKCIAPSGGGEREFRGNLCSRSNNIRKKRFCVESTNKIKFYEKTRRTPRVLYYHFALDFTPTKPFPPEELKVTKLSEKIYEIRFKPEEGIKEYNLHYTTWPGVVNKKGSLEEIFFEYTGIGNYFHKTIKLIVPQEENCPPQEKPGEVGEVYSCSEKIIYFLKDEQIPSTGEVWFTVTSLKEGKESLSPGFSQASS